MRKFILLITSLLVMSFSTLEYNKGVASFYGKEHHGRYMANGKKFNMYSLTAAHKTYPFGTKLEVINVNNEKSVIVEVTDRGPFIKGRVLDLSQGAFEKIASIKSGVINVKYKIIK